ncbi:MAG: phosphopyruvate hydratase [Candidatus Harrisonbacteria bacterium RIFCSPHIGHO2_02_FULL_42_16]|uniref:Enolase n=1 Tax=Candidatus Harrisonbacteria bacterium RIFCSPHIGHO2_02_FULL_42_16 TaxID=1798404 RepID=A0A1G1ZI34_9BACT|nr:MAG: phosphopyruvate hydratase [Candidatus Harrisonbacteria bacterium RIFCSPHIGHO2_02_FULL_42_16]
MKAVIKNIFAEEILDSRGNPTLRVGVATGAGTGIFSVPSGASTGKYEALEKRDNDPERFRGLGVKKALAAIEKEIAPCLKGFSVLEQKKIDRAMIKLDGTPNKRRLGGNALIGVSIAVAKAGALASKKPLYKYLHDSFFPKEKMVAPKLYMNLINGGKHAKNNLAFQEYLVVPQTNFVKDALKFGCRVLAELKKIVVKKYGKASFEIGDEGGLAPAISDVEEPLRLLAEAARKVGGLKWKLALDVAATSFYKNKKYTIAGKKLPAEKLLEFYKKIINKYPLLSIEDPFQEEDFKNFSRFKKETEKNGVFIVGDDLTVTNPNRLRKAIFEQSIGGGIIKPNQIGTLTETIEAINLAKKNRIKIIVSHRSGETNDDFIGDLAYACGAFGIKAGAPQPKERLAKYNRLLEIQRITNVYE